MFKRRGKGGGKRLRRFIGICSRRWRCSSRGGITMIRIMKTKRRRRTWAGGGRVRGGGNR